MTGRKGPCTPSRSRPSSSAMPHYQVNSTIFLGASCQSLTCMILSSAGSILVLPRGPEPQQALLLAGRRKHALESELKGIAAKHMTRLDEEDGGGFVELSQQEKERRVACLPLFLVVRSVGKAVCGADERDAGCQDLLLGRLARTNDEHALRKAQVFRHKDEWWQDLWSQSRARYQLVCASVGALVLSASAVVLACAVLVCPLLCSALFRVRLHRGVVQGA